MAKIQLYLGKYINFGVDNGKVWGDLDELHGIVQVEITDKKEIIQLLELAKQELYKQKTRASDNL